MDRENLDAYMGSVGETITPRMKILVVGETPEVVEEPSGPARTVVIEFESARRFASGTTPTPTRTSSSCPRLGRGQAYRR